MFGFVQKISVLVQTQNLCIQCFICSFFRSFGRSFTFFFLQALDKSGSGTCSLIEFRQMMKKFKIDLNEEEFFHLFSFYDKNITGKISYNDFLRAHLEWNCFPLWCTLPDARTLNAYGNTSMEGCRDRRSSAVYYLPLILNVVYKSKKSLVKDN